MRQSLLLDPQHLPALWARTARRYGELGQACAEQFRPAPPEPHIRFAGLPLTVTPIWIVLSLAALDLRADALTRLALASFPRPRGAR